MAGGSGAGGPAEAASEAGAEEGPPAPDEGTAAPPAAGPPTVGANPSKAFSLDAGAAPASMAAFASFALLYAAVRASANSSVLTLMANVCASASAPPRSFESLKSFPPKISRVDLLGCGVCERKLEQSERETSTTNHFCKAYASHL